MSKLKKITVSVILCMVMLLGSSLTSMAASGNASYGGATATWSMSSRSFSSTLKNRTPADLKIDVKLYIGSSLTPYMYESSFVNTAADATTCPADADLGIFDYFLTGNVVKMYVNNSNFITFNPYP